MHDVFYFVRVSRLVFGVSDGIHGPRSSISRRNTYCSGYRVSPKYIFTTFFVSHTGSYNIQFRTLSVFIRSNPESEKLSCCGKVRKGVKILNENVWNGVRFAIYIFMMRLEDIRDVWAECRGKVWFISVDLRWNKKKTNGQTAFGTRKY